MDSLAERKSCGTCRFSRVNNHNNKECKRWCHLRGYDQWQPIYFTDEELKTPSALNSQVGGNHYAMVIQPIEFIVKNDIPYREGNAIKYICRHKKKNGKQDIEKAIHYLQMILEDYDHE